jgi:hypothetical protein
MHNNTYKIFVLIVTTSLFYKCSLDEKTSPTLPYDLDFATIDKYFAHPPSQYRIVQYQMNKNLDEKHLDVLKSYGIGGVQHSVAWDNKYLENEAAWDTLAANVDKANKAGLRVWIHDEKGYPSGAAGGLVVREHPENENIGLVRITRQGKGEGKVIIEQPDSIQFIRAMLYPFINGEVDLHKAREIAVAGRAVETIGLAGDWQLSVFGTLILNKNTQAQSTTKQFKQTGHYPNLLNQDAPREFIKWTHQGYANHLPDIGRQVDVFYTGEPNLMTTYWQYDGTKAKYAYVPWEKQVPDQFKRQHGYDLLPCLEALFAGNTPEAKMVRLAFYQTIAEMFAVNYAKAITEWCENHGVQSLGHLLLEEYLACHVIYYGDMIKALRQFHIPACDIPIARNDTMKWEFWMAKFISSAAYLDDKRSMVTALLDPIIGGFGMRDLSPEIKNLRKTITMNFLCGINQISTYIPFKDYTSDEYQSLNEYIGRMAVMLRGAKNEARIAMYYPIETFQANYVVSPYPWNIMIRNYEYWQGTLDRMASGMLRNGMDFNYLTADAINNATIEDGLIQAGLFRYRAIVMPRVEVIPLQVLRKLKACSEAGVSIFWVDALPALGTDQAEHEKVKNIASLLTRNDAPLEQLKKIKDEDFNIDFESDDDKLCVGRYSRENRRLYFVVNDSAKEINVSVSAATGIRVKIYDPDSGRIADGKLPLQLKIGAYSSLFLVD